MKGHDVRSKSVRTQRQYKNLLSNQVTLTSLGFVRNLNFISSNAPDTADTDTLSPGPVDHCDKIVEVQVSREKMAPEPEAPPSDASDDGADGLEGDLWETEHDERVKS